MIGNVQLLRDLQLKLQSTYGRNVYNKIAVLKTAEQAKGGSLGSLGGAIGAKAGGITGSVIGGVAGSIAGDLLGLNSKDIDADVIFSYDHKASVRLTENPVESGVLTNDHRIIEARKLTIEIGINNVDNSPASKNNAILRGVGLLLFGDSPNLQSKIITTYADLLECQRNGEPFDIETPVGTYKNMLIIDIEALQDETSINVFKGSIYFQELIYYELTKSSLISQTSGVIGAIETGVKKAQAVTAKALSFLPTKTQSVIREIF
jgi:hypothetical protein